MSELQLYAFADGTVRENEEWRAPTQGKQIEVLEEAFSCSGKFVFNWIDREGPLRRVRLDYGGKQREIAFVNRVVGGGGRPATRPRELRVQIQPDLYNEIVERNLGGEIGLLIGVYVNGEDTALTIWRPMVCSMGAGSASKQVDAEIVARSMQLGYEMQIYPNGEMVVWAGRPELFLAYLDYLELAPPISGTAIANENNDAISKMDLEQNLIYFGAPGTGKSYQMNMLVKERFDEDKMRRVTFHPDYTYAQFVGSFKPYSDPEKGNEITYKYITGPFLDTYLEAITHPDSNYVLVIEELNRANPAAVFGNIFQLLDRGEHGNSEYSVATQAEMRTCIGDYFDKLCPEEQEAIENYYDDVGYEGFRKMSMEHLIIPSNMYIWATMNSADQGVYSMDTAFKRRWDFEYLGLDDGEEIVCDYDIPDGGIGRTVKWNELRKAINKKLKFAKVNEDKMLGPFFIPPKVLAEPEGFSSVFKGKVLLYLYEDAAKTKRSQLFKDGAWTYSEICRIYDKEGVEGIFEDMHLVHAEVEEAGGEEDSE